MTTIFISHSSRDDKFVNTLATSLHKHQFKTWIDHVNTPDGMLWANIIQDGLEKGDHMILVVTEGSMQSRHVRIEWQSFQGLVKPMILLILDEDIEIPKLLQDYPSVNWSYTKEHDQNLEALLKHIPKATLSSPYQAQTEAQLPKTSQLNPNTPGLDELQKLAGQIDNHTEPVIGSSEIKLIIPKSDVSVSYHVDRPMRVGRASPHDIERPDIDLNPYESIKTVSRNHATLNITNGAVMLTDVGSSNGTFVDGKRLKPNIPAKIKSGTMVRFGALIVQIMQGT